VLTGIVGFFDTKPATRSDDVGIAITALIMGLFLLAGAWFSGRRARGASTAG
jgi:hypothetical protein